MYFRVIDEGSGIAPDVINRIFDPFFTTKESGNGLGLATVFGAIRRHSGCLGLASRPNHGTSFTAYLPVECAAIEAPGKRLAIVDDDDAVRMTLQRVLVKQGYDVISMASGEEAMARIGELGRCDGVVLDQQMPGMDGLQTYRKLREQLRSLPVCFVSAFKLSEEVGQVVRVDNKCEAITKPFSIEDVDETLRSLLGK